MSTLDEVVSAGRGAAQRFLVHRARQPRRRRARLDAGDRARPARARQRGRALRSRSGAAARLAFLPGADARSSPSRRRRSRSTPTFVHDCGDAQLLGDRFPSREVTGPLVVLDHHASGATVRRPRRARPVGVGGRRDGRAPARARSACRSTEPIAECLWCSLASRHRLVPLSVDRRRDHAAGARRASSAGAVPWEFAAALRGGAAGRRGCSCWRCVLETLELGRRAVALLTLERRDADGDGTPPPRCRGLRQLRARARRHRGRRRCSRAGATACACSLRSKGDVDVGAVAAQFGGGGHRAAAGCIVPRARSPRRAKLLARCVEAASQNDRRPRRRQAARA